MASIEKFIQYIKDVRSEMAKVTWPTREELTGATLLVIIMSIVISFFVFCCDQVLNRIIRFLLKVNF